MPFASTFGAITARAYGLFSQALQAVDQYFNYVTLLLSGNGTNGAQNNTFLDSSTNNFTITRNGNTTQGTFSPFSQTGWGNYFDGTSDNLSVASTNQVLPSGTQNYSVEFFAFVVSSPNIYGVLVEAKEATGGFQISYTNDGGADQNKIGIAIYGVGYICSAIFNTYFNRWVHIVATRSGNDHRLFLNGTLAAYASNSYSFAAVSTQTFGSQASGLYGLNMYLSNVRTCLGSIPSAYQTTSTSVNAVIFTPPSTVLTSTSQGATSGDVKLLTCQSNRFVDNSTNAFAITRNGDVSVQAFSPFNPTSAWSAAANGGSGYFDGSGDYLALPSSSNLALGSGDFCVETWVYGTVAAVSGLIGNSTSSGDGDAQYELQIGTSYYPKFIGWNTVFLTSSVVITFSQWNHLTVTRSGTTCSMFLNGTRVATATVSQNFSSTNALNIGRQAAGTSPFTGYLAGTRIVKGSFVYDPTQTTCTVPTAPPTAITNTSLLLNFTNGAIFDNAAVADYETVGDAQISTSVKKYGTGSMSFDGTGDWLVSPASPSWDFGSGDFTVELWINPSATTAVEALVSKGNASSTGNEVWTLQWYGTNQLAFFSGGGLGTPVVTTGSVFATGNWYHVAVCRTAGVTKIFVNGTEQGTSTTSYTITAGGALYVGAGWYAPASRDISGYIDDLRITKGIARYPYSFTPPTAAFPGIGGTVTLTADPYFDYTTLLLPGNGTNGAQNNTFLDSSTNAFSITRNGNTTQGTFSPFSQTGWGNYFDGDGDYLNGPSSTAFAFGTGDFTVEAIIYPTATKSIANAIFDSVAISGSGSRANAILFFVTPTNTLAAFHAGSRFVESTTTVLLNAWTHVAITRSGTSVKLWINGVDSATATNSANLSDQNCNIGVTADIPTNAGGFFQGFISSLRIVKGTAVYTSNFTPPTTPLTAITNTSLLTCQSNRFIDNSTNNFAITRNGDVSVQAFSPFNPTASWSAATNGGSGYFDGSGDWLSAPANTAFDFGTGAFTIEAWVYLSTVVNNASVFVPASYGGGNGDWILRVAPGGGSAPAGTWEFTTFWGGTAYQAYSNSSATAGAWVHLAGVRNGNTFTLYVNGVAQTATATNSNSVGFNSRATLICGDNSSGVFLTGYVSNARVVKGTAVYTANFTPPTAPLTAITNTSLLLNFTNGAIYDAAAKNDLETVGNAQISTAQSKWGGSSMYFDGTGDYLVTAAPSTVPFAFGTGDFTVECWAYFSALSAANIIYDGRPLATNTTQPTIYVNSAGNLFYFANNANQIQAGASSVTTATWYHIAVARSGTSTRMFLNGVQVGSTYSDSTNYTNTSGRPIIGVDGNSGNTNYLNGYIQDLRITKGIARYTSNFTPPTTAFLTL